MYICTCICIYTHVYYTVTTFKNTDFKIYEQALSTTSGKVFLARHGHLNKRNPIHLNIR